MITSRKNRIEHVCLALLFMLSVSLQMSGQSILVAPSDKTQQFEGGEYKARVDFISNLNTLNIEENNGETVNAPVKTNDGKYVYTCVCDVIDTNNFGFIISVAGSSESQRVNIYIEEGQYFVYDVQVDDIPMSITDVKITNQNQVVPREKVAAATVTCQFSQLTVESLTGEKVEGPTLNKNNTFDYVIYYDLSDDNSRQQNRTLRFTINQKDFEELEIGALSPKQGIEITVNVVQESCYGHAISQATAFYTNGLYREAYLAYQDATKCDDKPADTAGNMKKMENSRALAAAIQRAQASYDKAERFQRQGMVDSCMFYHQDAYKYRSAVLKVHHSDPYCLEYQRKYENLRSTLPRIVTGTVLNNIRMDGSGNNLPIDGAYVVCRVFKLETQRVNGVPVEKVGEEIKGKIQTLGQTDSKGQFRVYVPRNTPGERVVLFFTDDKEFKGKAKPIEYTPTDADIQSGLTVKITPNNINRN